MSQRALARAIGTHQNVVGRWIRGETSPSAPHLAELAVALETSIDWLVLGRDSVEGASRTRGDRVAGQLAELAPALTEAAAIARDAARSGV